MTILAAVSGEQAEDRVVEVGHDLAAVYGDEFVVLHVMEGDEFDDLRGSDTVLGPVWVGGPDDQSNVAYVSSGERASEYDLEDAASDAKAVARTVVNETLDTVQRPVTTEGRVGDPAEEILRTADSTDARFVVVGGRKRTPVGKAIFGSVSQSVILSADQPIVAVTRDE